MTHVLDTEQFPRDAGHRYRIYFRDGKLRCIAACPDAESLGVALVQLDTDAKEAGRRLADEGTFGVLDAVTGRWIVSPFRRGKP